MTNAEILKRALEKADYNGFDSVKAIGFCIDCSDYDFYLNKCQETKDYYRYIFSHNFAKAFWGEECYYQDEENQLLDGILCWQYHLKIMILLEEPLKYLEKFL